MYKCQLDKCDKYFLKSAGSHVHGKWFCCDEHVEQDPATMEYLELRAKVLVYNEKGEEIDL